MSSLCRLSWKHSRPWAGRTMLCAEAVEAATAATSKALVAERKCIVEGKSDGSRIIDVTAEREKEERKREAKGARADWMAKWAWRKGSSGSWIET